MKDDDGDSEQGLQLSLHQGQLKAVGLVPSLPQAHRSSTCAVYQGPACTHASETARKPDQPPPPLLNLPFSRELTDATPLSSL